MFSFAARHGDDPRTLLLIAPGWVKTEFPTRTAAESLLGDVLEIYAKSHDQWFKVADLRSRKRGRWTEYGCNHRS